MSDNHSYKNKPAHDYLCEMCAEIFEERYGRDEKPIAVTCPVCGTGRTRKIISSPAISIWWRNPRASSDVSGLKPKFKKPVKNRALKRR